MSADASPSALLVSLSTSSNLLAHHLNVLEHAGLVRPTRSEVTVGAPT
jgi:ArsR family transcriptional regulator, arsenate/arsenite/antimonite-responsive transcriptional repressor / arsenate reductase (thioredoxin)